MGRPTVLLALALIACSAPAPRPVALARGESIAREAVIRELADSIFAAARARDADRFASHFSARPDFVYLINTRRISSREALRATFEAMLSRQHAFDVQWEGSVVQMLTPVSGVFTGRFRTRARRVDGEEWEASGVVTFVAVREAVGWRVVNWHTTEQVASAVAAHRAGTRGGAGARLLVAPGARAGRHIPTRRRAGGGDPVPTPAGPERPSRSGVGVEGSRAGGAPAVAQPRSVDPAPARSSSGP